MIEHLETGRWYGGYDCGRYKRMQLYPDPLPSTEIKNGFILVKGILENGYPNYFVFKIGDNEWLRSDWFYENAKKYFDEISAQERDMKKDLGTMNGWGKSKPPEYDAHLANCGKPHPTYPQYRHFNVVEKKLGNCYYSYHCQDCGILYRVDSSD